MFSSVSLVMLCYGVVFLERNDSCGIVNVISTGYQKPLKIHQVNKCQLAKKRSSPLVHFIFPHFRLLFEGVNIMTASKLETWMKVINKR